MNVNTDRLNIEWAVIGRYACYWSIEASGSVGAVNVRNRQLTVFGDKILAPELGSVAVLWSLIRIRTGGGILRPRRPPRKYLGEYTSRWKPKIPPADRIFTDPGHKARIFRIREEEEN